MQELSGVNIPQPNCFVRTATCERAPIGTECNAENITRMPRKSLQELSGTNIPQPDGFVITPAGEHAAIRTERNTVDITHLPRKQRDFLIGLCIVEPNSHRTRNSNQSPFGGKLNLIDAAFAEARCGSFR